MFDYSHKSQYIGGQKEKFVRLDDLDSNLSLPSNQVGRKRWRFNLGLPFAGKKRKSKSVSDGVNNGSGESLTFVESLSAIAKTVIPKDLKVSDEKSIFDPQDKSLLIWNRLFVLSSFLGVAIDPLFFYLLFFERDDHCLTMDGRLAGTITMLRSMLDFFYGIRIYLKFHTAYIAPSSRVFGRGELVVDPALISKQYLRFHFIVDSLSVLPLPQFLVVTTSLPDLAQSVLNFQLVLRDSIILQFIPRSFRLVPLMSESKKNVGVFAESAVAGVAKYLLWFMLSSHVVGALWYLLAVERYINCWKKACTDSHFLHCDYLFCGYTDVAGFDDWKRFSINIYEKTCRPNDQNSDFNFGIYSQAIGSEVHESHSAVSRFFYCLWFGLQNLSTLGQGLKTTTIPREVIFSISVGIGGLVLFALLIGNMQTYLASLTLRLEEMRIKRRDFEQWMHRRWLPQDLRERVRQYDHFKWLETRGVDEEILVQSLPKDLRRDIKRHLCLNLVRRVPLFANMDERLLDAICERLKPSLCTEGTCVVREGDPVDEMLLIIRGSLESITTDGGRTGFYNRGLLKEGDFCGEELLTWALDPKSSTNLPLSTRTVRALEEVEAFALEVEELKFVASQFRRLHSREVQHTFRFYSQQWRTWATCFIQATWRRRRHRKEVAELLKGERSFDYREVGHEAVVDRQSDQPGDAHTSSRATALASRFASNALRGNIKPTPVATSPPGRLINLQKPSEPDFGTN